MLVYEVFWGEVIEDLTPLWVTSRGCQSIGLLRCLSLFRGIFGWSKDSCAGGSLANDLNRDARAEGMGSGVAPEIMGPQLHTGGISCLSHDRPAAS
jgi:hypothetical protein